MNIKPPQKKFDIPTPGKRPVEDILLDESAGEQKINKSYQYQSTPSSTPGRRKSTESWKRGTFLLSERHFQLVHDIVSQARRTRDTNYNQRNAIEEALELLAKAYNVNFTPLNSNVK